MSGRRKLVISFAAFLLFILAIQCGDKSTGPSDTTPPARVTTLTIVDQVDDIVSLSWLATGDDSLSGLAEEYLLKYSLVPLVDSNWQQATEIEDVPKPGTPGRLEDCSTRLQGTKPADTVYFGLKVKDNAGHWSALSNIPFTTELKIDTIPPAAISDLVVFEISLDDFRLYWTSPGDDSSAGQATGYEIRYSVSEITAANFEEAAMVELPGIPAPAGRLDSLTINDLEPFRDYWFALKTSDNVGQWSEISNVVKVSTVDTIPPAPVTDLRTAKILLSKYILHWTAPGDDSTTGKVTGYIVRYADHEITDENFDSAPSIPFPHSASLAGTKDSLIVYNLERMKEYWFALKSVDNAGNWSAISNTARISTIDTIPPATVNDLFATNVGPGEVMLYWSAPGDDSLTGRATHYDIRYHAGEFTAETFGDATQLYFAGEPSMATNSDSLKVTGLSDGIDYWFALRASDLIPNWSEVSNIATVTTIPDLPPNRITDLTVSDVSGNNVTITWTAPGGDSTFGRAASYDIRYATVNATYWWQWTPVSNPPTPKVSGQTETLTVRNLAYGQLYYFAIVAIDNSRLESARSYSTHTTTETKVSLLWDKHLVTEYSARPLRALYDGTGIVVCGDAYTESGNGDAYLAKVNADGEFIWQNRFGGARNEKLTEICQVPGGYVVAGYIYNGDSAKTDALLVMINQYGDTVWTRSYGYSGTDEAATGVAYSDGIIALSGSWNPAPGRGSFIACFDESGNLLNFDRWQPYSCMSYYGINVAEEIVGSTGGDFVVGWNTFIPEFGGHSEPYCDEYRDGYQLRTVQNVPGLNEQTILDFMRLMEDIEDWTGMISLSDGDFGGVFDHPTGSSKIKRFSSTGAQMWETSLAGDATALCELPNHNLAAISSVGQVSVVGQFGNLVHGTFPLPCVQYQYYKGIVSLPNGDLIASSYVIMTNPTEWQVHLARIEINE